MIKEAEPEPLASSGKQLPPVIANSDGQPNLVSVPVSVLDLAAPNSLLRKQLELEAGVGIALRNPRIYA